MPVMSAAHVSASHSSYHSRPLLQSRSLRDLHGPPPPIPDKSHHRTFQVNSPQVLGLPNTERVHSDVQSWAPASFIQATSSPGTPKRGVHTQSNYHSIYRSTGEVLSTPGASLDMENRLPITRPSTSPKCKEGRREPPIDPRKARRYGSDFGLARHRPSLPTIGRPSPSPPVPDNSSLASTPLTLYTEGETDSDTDSFDHSLELSFPQPPPMDDFTRLRRMHSSPMFTSEEINTFKDFPREHYIGLAQKSIAENPPTGYDRWDTYSHILDQTSLSFDYDNRPEIIGHAGAQMSHETSPPAHLKREKTSSSTPTSVQLTRGRNVPSRKRATATPTRREQRDRLEDMPHTPLRTQPNDGSSWGSIRLPSDLSDSVDRLDFSIKKLKTHAPPEHQTTPSRNAHVQLKDVPSILPNPPSLASAGRRKPMRHMNHSIPPTGHNFANVNNISPTPKSLGTPFHHRTAGSQANTLHISIEQEQPPPKSFIDITPEHNQHTGSRERMRKLLARASITILKTFNRGKSGSK